LVTEVRQRFIRIYVYLDDWLLLASSEAEGRRQTQEVLELAQSLGFVPNLSKCDLTPSQQFTYLGMHVDTTCMLVRPTLVRMNRLQATLQDLRSRETAPARLLASLLGIMESLAPLIPQGRLLKRPLQRAFRARWDQASQPWNRPVSLGQWFLEATQPWLDVPSLMVGVPVVPPSPQHDLYTDASCGGWGGGHVDSLHASGVWSREESLLHINLLELEAVRLSLIAFLPHLRGKVVRLFTDNTTVSFYINKQGGGGHGRPACR
jgi:hypothetical protein